MTHKENWEGLDIVKALREGKGFLIIANLVLGSFQRRMGDVLGVKPGEEMRAAVETADALGIPHTLCDREVQTTLRRAWAKCGLWGKCKLLASLISSAFTTEELAETEIESLKDKSALDAMLAEISDFLPAVKETLIDERDRYLAAKIWESPGSRLVAIVGAGHVPGLSAQLERIAAAGDGGKALCDVRDLETIPPKSLVSRAAPAIIPAVIVALIAVGFFRLGPNVSLNMVLRWLLWNGGLAAVGAIAALAHPLAVLAAIVGAPAGTISPVLSVGMFSGVAQALLVRPRVGDAEDLSADVTSLKGIYRNRITRALLVFFLSSLGGMIGNLISIPSLAGILSS
jgi:pheromone shutdown-related protein TraB